MSKKRQLEWSFFLNDRNRVTYNECHDCKQSFRAVVIECPKYLSKRSHKGAEKKRENGAEPETSEQTSQVLFHTDQGAVYSSQAFCQAHNDYNILRSMSRVGTPTDNPIIEALNGWIKEESFLDFDLAHAKDVPALLDSYVDFFNNHNVLLPPWATKAQFSTRPNWAFVSYALWGVYFYLTDAAAFSAVAP